MLNKCFENSDKLENFIKQNRSVTEFLLFFPIVAFYFHEAIKTGIKI